MLTPKGGAPSDPFYICRVVRITPEGPRLVAMINPPAFTRTARGLPVRSGGVETDAPVTPAVETVIRGMAEAMVGEDPDALREICSSPVVWIADEGTLVMDETNFEERFAALREGAGSTTAGPRPSSSRWRARPLTATRCRSCGARSR